MTVALGEQQVASPGGTAESAEPRLPDAYDEHPTTTHTTFPDNQIS